MGFKRPLVRIQSLGPRSVFRKEYGPFFFTCSLNQWPLGAEGACNPLDEVKRQPLKRRLSAVREEASPSARYMVARPRYRKRLLAPKGLLPHFKMLLDSVRTYDLAFNGDAFNIFNHEVIEFAVDTQ